MGIEKVDKMNNDQAEMNEAQTGLSDESTDAETQRREHPLWLSADEADVLLTMCSLSPVSAGELEDALFRKIGNLLASFETPRPKDL
ncbi:MAG: hypothetical protein H7145_23845 [Akkermansiaceae bacterium]|nr:hypothetical protein [Armatimonadota bacterium]